VLLGVTIVYVSDHVVHAMQKLHFCELC